MAIIRTQMSIESNDPDELRRILDHHIEYLVDMDNNKNIVTSISNVQSYDTEDKNNVSKLSMLSEILSDILITEPSDDDLNNDDDLIDLYAELHNLKTSLENVGLL